MLPSNCFNFCAFVAREFSSKLRDNKEGKKKEGIAINKQQNKATKFKPLQRGYKMETQTEIKLATLQKTKAAKVQTSSTPSLGEIRKNLRDDLKKNGGRRKITGIYQAKKVLVLLVLLLLQPLLLFIYYVLRILLYPEEGWARTASSSYWTITPCWWQPNRCRIEEFMGASQRQSTKAKMVPLEQKGSLLIAGNFGRSKSKNKKHQQQSKDVHDDEFKLYLSSNISMEDYNMGYCLTGFVERRCQQTNTFQMTHFAVIKRQWPSISNDVKST